MNIKDIVLFQHAGAIRAGVVVAKVTTEDINGERSIIRITYMKDDGESATLDRVEEELQNARYAYDMQKYVEASETMKDAQKLLRAIEAESAKPAPESESETSAPSVTDGEPQF